MPSQEVRPRYVSSPPGRLGHGIGSLRHPFDDAANVRGNTANLMDYNNGEELYHFQWDLMQNPKRRIFRWRFDEEEGEMIDFDRNNWPYAHEDAGKKIYFVYSPYCSKVLSDYLKKGDIQLVDTLINKWKVQDNSDFYKDSKFTFVKLGIPQYDKMIDIFCREFHKNRHICDVDKNSSCYSDRVYYLLCNDSCVLFVKRIELDIVDKTSSPHVHTTDIKDIISLKYAKSTKLSVSEIAMKRWLLPEALFRLDFFLNGGVTVLDISANVAANVQGNPLLKKLLTPDGNTLVYSFGAGCGFGLVYDRNCVGLYGNLGSFASALYKSGQEGNLKIIDYSSFEQTENQTNFFIGATCGLSRCEYFCWGFSNVADAFGPGQALSVGVSIENFVGMSANALTNSKGQICGFGRGYGADLSPAPFSVSSVGTNNRGFIMTLNEFFNYCLYIVSAGGNVVPNDQWIKESDYYITSNANKIVKSGDK